MELRFFIDQLTANRNVFKHLFGSIDKELQVWKQSDEKWCLLEIICHLYDEEREDFRQRFQYMLERPQDDPPSINPPAWVTDRQYMNQQFDKKVASFLQERDDSIKYLNSLDHVPWENVYNHKHFGPITAKHYLHNWLAHDLLHIKQITRLKYDYILSKTDQNMTYAGEWK